MTATPTTVPDRTTMRIAGLFLAAAAVLTLVLVLHHPVLAGRHDIAAAAVAVQRLGQLDRIVHGGLMAVLGLQAVCFFVFSKALGFRNPAVGAGLIAFVAGVVIMVIPATLDGFVTPDLAETCLRMPGGCIGADAGLFRLVSVMIQDFTKVALVAVAAATACWSLALVFRKGLACRIAGLIGLACAALPAWILLFTGVHLRPGNLAGIIAAQVVWSLVVAGLMIGGVRLADPGRD